MFALGCVCSRSDDFSPATIKGALGDLAKVQIVSLSIQSGECLSESLRSCNQDRNILLPLWIRSGCNLYLFCHTEVDYEGHNPSMAYLLKETKTLTLVEYTNQDAKVYLH